MVPLLLFDAWQYLGIKVKYQHIAPVGRTLDRVVERAINCREWEVHHSVNVALERGRCLCRFEVERTVELVMFELLRQALVFVAQACSIVRSPREQPMAQAAHD